MQKKLEESQDRRLEWIKRMDKVKSVISWRERELGQEAKSTIDAKLEKVELLLEIYKYGEAKSTLVSVEKYWNFMTRETR